MDALLGRVSAHRTHAVQSTTLSNGTAERWVGSCRREILDHVIALDERHLLRLMRDYVNYHHEDRIHDSLSKDTPNGRPIEQKPSARSGGLQHRYFWEEAT
jgi:putative transposase